MSLEFYQNVESKRMHYNARKVCEEVALRVDASPGPGGYLTAYKSDDLDEMFFTDAEFLQAFIKSPSSNKPGSTYYKVLQSFVESYFFIGMKFIEFIKCEAAYQDDCSYCSDNPRKIETIKRCPQPEPDHSQLPEFHYKRPDDVMMLPNVEFVDKWNPRYNIKKQFEVGKLKLFDTGSIKEFSQKYILKKEIIKNSIYRPTKSKG